MIRISVQGNDARFTEQELQKNISSAFKLFQKYAQLYQDMADECIDEERANILEARSQDMAFAASVLNYAFLDSAALEYLLKVLGEEL